MLANKPESRQTSGGMWYGILYLFRHGGDKAMRMSRFIPVLGSIKSMPRPMSKVKALVTK